MSETQQSGGDVEHVPAMTTENAPKPSPKPRPKRRSSKPRKRAVKPVADSSTFIVGHDGKRVNTETYFQSEQDEPTFIVGHDGKRVQTQNYKEVS